MVHASVIDVALNVGDGKIDLLIRLPGHGQGNYHQNAGHRGRGLPEAAAIPTRPFVSKIFENSCLQPDGNRNGYHRFCDLRVELRHGAVPGRRGGDIESDVLARTFVVCVDLGAMRSAQVREHAGVFTIHFLGPPHGMEQRILEVRFRFVPAGTSRCRSADPSARQCPGN